MEKTSTQQKFRLLGGLIELTSSDLYRFHFRVGPLALYLESEKLYEVTQEMRRRKQVKK